MAKELDSSIQYLSGVGPKRAALLQRELGIETLSDLIHLYPFRYIDRSGITPIAEVAPDLAHVQLQATVVRRTLYGPGSSIVSQDTDPIHWGACKRLSVIVQDASGEMEMVFFKGIKWNYQRLVPGGTFLFFGKPQAFGTRLNIVHPEVDAAREADAAQGTLTGVYPSTEKLKTGGITGKVMCKLQGAALALCLPEIQETLPEYVIRDRGLVSLTYALHNIHFPKDSYALQKATYRLKFEELFLLQLSLLKQKYIRSRGERGLPMPKVGPDFHACYNALPYTLTGAQQRVIKEIRADLTSGHQMNRLLQGDVGSGKTMVAVLSCLMAIGNGFQTCIMAPTEVLAQQHYANIQKYLKPTSVQCALLTGSTPQKERRAIHAALEDGSLGILVGTHALLEDNVVFRNLGLAVIDEQHRFGVDQRSKLWGKGPKVPPDTFTPCTPSRGMAADRFARGAHALYQDNAVQREGGSSLPQETVAARGLVNGGTASEAQRWGPKDVSGACWPLPQQAPEVKVVDIKDVKGNKIAINLQGEKLFVACEAGVAEGTPEAFRALLEDPSVVKTGVDLKAQMKNLARRGIRLEGRLEDISLMHYLLGPERSHKLDVLARSYLGVELEAAAPQAETSLFDEVPEETGPDRILETAVILRLSDCLLNEMAATEGMTGLYDRIEEPLIGVLARMEQVGVKVDLGSLKEYADGLRRKMTEREAEVRRLAGDPALNILSPKQIGVLLFEKLQLDPKARKPKSGNWPTDEQTLSHLADRSPIIDAILDYRGLRKLLSTYIEPFAGYISPEDGRVHTTFNQALTATGRLSSSNPNLQNIPVRTEEGREIRKAFVPGEPGWVMMSADYSQIELRLMAHLCGDAHLLEAFRQGLDVHAATAAKIFRVPLAEVTADQRRIAKTANFGIMYGISSFGLAERLRCPRSEAKQIIDDYFASFPSIRGFIDQTVSQARERGYVETLFGRRRYIADIGNRNATLRALAERNAVNAPIQGTAADIIKLAMTAVDRGLCEGGYRARMVLQIHDELLLEVPQEEIAPVRELLVSKMENVISLSVPLTVECNDGNTWLEAH